jgi:DNA-binding CsgD family transcriptional regulator
LRERTSGSDWPLVGRSEELDLLRRFRAGGRGVSAFITGSAGVGKSRIAREALAEAEREGWATLVVRGSAGFATVPLGPFRTVFRHSGPSGLAELTESVTDGLVAMRSAKGLLLWVDDCQDLDEASTGLLHQVVAAGLVVAIITTRVGTSSPLGLTELWKDGFAERIELQNLSLRETTELLEAGLGGGLQESSAIRFWNVTAGNPLYLREVVLSAAETGALKQVDGEWRLKGEWARGARLQEIVAARLGRMDADEVQAMELLATAGPLPLAIVTELATMRAVQRLESRGLVTIEESGRRLEVAISHLLHAEVLRKSMPALRQRSVRRNIADALVATGARRTADRVRLACWSLELGLDVDPMTLSLGSDATLIGIGHAIAGRLMEILPEVAVELPADRPAVRQDNEVAVRLARAAYEQTGGLAEGVALATTLAWTGAVASAEAALADLATRSSVIDDRVRIALALSSVRFWGRYHVDEARTGVTEMATEAERVGCDPNLIADLYKELAGIAFNTAQPAAALVHAERSAALEGVELSLSGASPVAVAALVYLGRCGEAIALADRGVPMARNKGSLMAVAELLFARAGGLSRMGELDQARELIEWLRTVAQSEELEPASAVFGVALGEVLLRQGLPASAGRVLRDSVGVLAAYDRFGYRPWALACLARSRALSGEEASAAAALDEARRSQPISRHFDMALHLAEIELHSLAGRTGAAAASARAGAAWARAAGMISAEVQALEGWLRLEPSAELAERLGELAALTDNKLVAALAEYARALVAAEPASLLEVSERFGEMSAWRLAAEAASGAAQVLDRRQDARGAVAAARVAAGFAERCEGTLAPTTDGPSQPVRLTKREREIATLAATGASAKEIAERLYLSARTVESHLHHIYVKLGVTDRAALATALDG